MMMLTNSGTHSWLQEEEGIGSWSSDFKSFSLSPIVGCCQSHSVSPDLHFLTCEMMIVVFYQLLIIG